MYKMEFCVTCSCTEILYHNFLLHLYKKHAEIYREVSNGDKEVDICKIC